MDRQAVRDELRQIIGEHLKEQGLELVDLIYRYEGRDLFLRILTDKPQSGITINECARLNSEIGAILDEKAELGQRYILEVSSPGLDRPLAIKADFLRCINRKARFSLSEPVGGKFEWEGVIAGADERAVSVDIKGNTIEIELGKINKAKQII